MEKLLDEIKRIYRQQTAMWQSKLKDLHIERDKLQARIAELNEGYIERDQIIGRHKQEIAKLKEKRQEDADLFCREHNKLVDAREEIVKLKKLPFTIIQDSRNYYSEDIFLPDSDSIDAKSAGMARLVLDTLKGKMKQALDEIENKP